MIFKYVSKIGEIPIPPIHAYLQKLYPSRVFVYLKDLCKSRESTSANAGKSDFELSCVYI